MKKLLFNMVILGGLTLATVSCKNENKDNLNMAEAKDVAEATNEAMEFTVDTTESVIEWKGEKPTGIHHGIIKLQSGKFMANDSVVENGNFVIDMSTIEDQDLEGEDKANLENHLKGTVAGKEGDFFNINKFPEAKFAVTGVSERDGQLIMQGNLTIKDKTKNVEFPVKLNMNNDQMEITSDSFTIDRTNWGVNYGSKSVFDNLGDKFVNDEITLTVKVKANKV